MTDFDSSYKVVFSGDPHEDDDVLKVEHDFHLDELAISSSAAHEMPTLARDLLHIGMAVYVVDRLTKRPSPQTGGARAIQLTVEVADADFWRKPSVSEILHDVLDFLGDDYWDVRFTPYCPAHQTYFTKPPPQNGVICLYSGGLDSAAGLARTLEKQDRPVYAVTAEHHTQLKGRVKRHLRIFRRAYDADLLHVGVDTHLVGDASQSSQESSQRCRAFMFAALAGAFACCSGLCEIEMYENGVGAANLPLIYGSGVGGRTTRSAHPTFLRLMSELATRVARRKIIYKLPFRKHTKAELVSALRLSKDLQGLVGDTVSCANFPVRKAGPMHSCGVCPGCIERRYALACAGAKEDPKVYEYDWLAENGPEPPVQELDYLRATLLQAHKLKDVSPDNIPFFVEDYFERTSLVPRNESVEPWTQLLSRYAKEWTGLIERARQNGLFWCDWVKHRPQEPNHAETTRANGPAPDWASAG